MPLSVGTRLGPYEILAPLGAGGLGEVYRARDPRMGREVAIKVSAERFSDRFSREVHAVAALNHPNICQVYDVGPNYLVLELIDGPTLAERIATGARLGGREVCEDGTPRCEGADSKWPEPGEVQGSYCARAPISRCLTFRRWSARTKRYQPRVPIPTFLRPLGTV